MKTMRLLLLLLGIAVVVPVFASNPESFKEWQHSPQGYFMTKAERQEAAVINTQEEAQHFIDQFLVKRGPKFAGEVEIRASKADQLLTIGKLPGSQTLRGRLVIMLGPPSGLEVFPVRETSSVSRSSPAVANAYSGGLGHDDDTTESGRTMGSESVSQNYHFTFASTPAGPLDVNLNADVSSGKDRPRGRDDGKKLDAVFEAAAQASIKTK
jgi:GWxTD domain-containing protein